jgi:ribonuclease P protein component
MILCYSKPNGLSHPRLGLAVSRKTHKHSVKRNYMKRVLREWFRLRQQMLPCRDYVLVVKSAFDAPFRLNVYQELDRQLVLGEGS